MTHLTTWVGVVVSLHVGRGGLAGSVPTYRTHPTTWRGPVERLPLMWVECAVCVGCVEILGWPLVCVQPTLYTHRRSNPKQVYTKVPHKTAAIAYRLQVVW